MMRKDLIELAKQQAAEIARAGHNGWGNTMLALAVALESSVPVGVERIVSQQHDIAAPLREAEAQIAIALARLSKLGPGGLARYGWAGSWAEYQKIAQLLCKTRALAERIEHRQHRIPRNDSNAG